MDITIQFLVVVSSLLSLVIIFLWRIKMQYDGIYLSYCIWISNRVIVKNNKK